MEPRANFPWKLLPKAPISLKPKGEVDSNNCLSLKQFQRWGKKKPHTPQKKFWSHSNIQLWHFLNINICFMIENEFSFLSSRPYRLERDFQIVKYLTGNKIFHLIQYKILGLGYSESEVGSGGEWNYSSVEAWHIFTSYPIWEQKKMQFTNSHRKKKIFPG